MTPAEFTAAVEALKQHRAVAVPGGGILLPPTRGRRYRGKHRANQFSVRVADLVPPFKVAEFGGAR